MNYALRFFLYFFSCIHVMAAVHPMHFYAIIDT